MSIHRTRRFARKASAAVALAAALVPSGGSASVNPYDLDTNHGLKQWTPYR